MTGVQTCALPIYLILPLLWYGQAVIGAAAMGAALLERSRSGLGQAVTVSGLHGTAEVAGAVTKTVVPPHPAAARAAKPNTHDTMR